MRMLVGHELKIIDFTKDTIIKVPGDTKPTCKSSLLPINYIVCPFHYVISLHSFLILLAYLWMCGFFIVNFLFLRANSRSCVFSCVVMLSS